MFFKLVLAVLWMAVAGTSAGLLGVADLAKKVTLLPRTTSVRYVVPVVTSVQTVASTCFIPVNVTGDCRRRRAAFQERPVIIAVDDDVDIDAILPSVPRLESTAVSETDVSTSSPDLDGSLDWTSGRLDAQQEGKKRGWTLTATIHDLASLTRLDRWKTKPGFGFTYVDFKTSTITHTSVMTVTQGQKAFVVSGCLPSGFVYTTC